MRIQTILNIIPQTIQLLSQLFLIWITLDWKVRKTRKAFEEELIRKGISKKAAKQLSKQIKIAKDQIMSSLWQFAFK
ncbi:MAG: hypothetical protein OEY24_08735 [Candidatus Bathyarchaeota archaeon]|nr:hypothetical protein [Candidatus Bathyarchaeota archaeon]MDH5495768.1 hypothetical protein [Candidatus Bathyarchaeota archaeon]